MKYSKSNPEKNKAYFSLISSILILFTITTFVAISKQESYLIIILGIFSGFIFVASAYMRMYYIFKLDKLKRKHNHQSFLDYIDHFFEVRYTRILLIIPDLKKYNMYFLEKYRKKINVWTLWFWVFSLIYTYFIFTI